MRDLPTRIIYGTKYLFLVFLAITYSKESFTILFIIIGVRCAYEMFLLRRNKTKIIPLLYIIIPFILVHPLAFWETKFDSTLVLGIFVLTWIFDSSCYIIGVPFGNHKILPVVSPKKSWEGFLGGVISLLVASYVLSLNMQEIYQQYSSIWWQFTLILPFTAITGDFIESYYYNHLLILSLRMDLDIYLYDNP